MFQTELGPAASSFLSRFALRGLENKAFLSVLSSYQNLGWGLGSMGSPNLGPALEKESVLCLCRDGGGMGYRRAVLLCATAVSLWPQTQSLVVDVLPQTDTNAHTHTLCPKATCDHSHT